MELRDYQAEARDAALGTDIGQFILPTGTGKTVIEGAIFEGLIQKPKKNKFGVYVVLTPRIMLTNQLMKEVVVHLIKSGITAVEVLTVHSGKPAKLMSEDMDDAEMSVFARLESESTTDYTVVSEYIRRGKRQKKPILICCTYDSSPILTKAFRLEGIQAESVLCDEAHYIVEQQFNKNIADIKPLTKRIHFFTATQKITLGDDGNGMNNESFYGPVLLRRSPREMIDAGYMVRPRIHFEQAEASTAWSRVISDAFTMHQSLVKYNAKMLVCCNGTQTIEEIISDAGFIDWATKEKVTVFAVCSAFGSKVDGVEVDRETFLNRLRGHSGKAIILHINILTEGIDVPDLTGVMFIRNMGVTRFLQSLGRATRVHHDDFGKSTDSFSSNSSSWTKPYAWAIIAERDGDFEGKTAGLTTIINDMREAGYEPMEQVMIGVDRGTGATVEIEPCNMANTGKPTVMFNAVFEINHRIEGEDKAALYQSFKFESVDKKLSELEMLF